MDSNMKKPSVIIECNKYYKDLHIYLIIMTVSVLCGVFCKQLQDICERLNSVMNIFDPFLMINNNLYAHLCIVIGILLINSKLSLMDDNVYAILIRTGKIKWLCNKLLLLTFNVVIYLSSILVFTVLFTMQDTFLGNYWSTLIRGTAMNLDYVLNNNPPVLFSLNMVNRITTYEAIIYTFCLMSIYCITLSLIMFIINLKFRTNVGFLFSLGIHFIGWICNYLDKTLMYISPMNNSMLVSHSFGSGANPSILYSYIFLFIIVLSLIFLSKRIICKCDF